MKQACGIWFPDDEKHLVDMVSRSPRVDGKGTYQLHKLEAALKFVPKRRLALDVGMHVGLWAMHLVKTFKTVIGFEPVADHLHCLARNMAEANVTNWKVHPLALGNKNANVGLKLMKGSTGSTAIAEEDGVIPMKRLDDFEFTDPVDFVKIDVEGYEYMVLEGAEQTLRRHKPVVIVEQKPGKVEWFGHKQYDARDLLISWGARQVFEMQGDCCLTWRK